MADAAPTLTGPPAGAWLRKQAPGNLTWTRAGGGAHEAQIVMRYIEGVNPTVLYTTTQSSGNGSWPLPTTLAAGRGGWRVPTRPVGSSGPWDGTLSDWRLLRISDNPAPLAPTLLHPTFGGAVDVTVATTLRWRSNDNGTQQAAQARWRKVGTSAFTTVTVSGPSQQHVVPADTFVDGESYEWQVRTADNLGYGPWSPLEPFTGGVTPTDVTLVVPANGAIVHSPTATMEWSTPDQDAAEVRVTIDGEAEPYWTGEVDGPARTIDDVPYPDETDVRSEVRVLDGGLWSAWVGRVNPVSYAPPPTPEAVVSVDNPPGAISVHWTTPAPGDAQPAADYVEVWRRTVRPPRRPRAVAQPVAGPAVGSHEVTAPDGNLTTVPIVSPPAPELPVETTDLRQLPTLGAQLHDTAGVFEDFEAASMAVHHYQVVAVATSGARAATPWMTGAAIVAGADDDQWELTANRDGRLTTATTDDAVTVTAVDGYPLTAGPDGALTTGDA